MTVHEWLQVLALQNSDVDEDDGNGSEEDEELAQTHLQEDMASLNRHVATSRDSAFGVAEAVALEGSDLAWNLL